MKIFFIGPYKDLTMDGFVSRKIIENLQNIPGIDLCLNHIVLSNKTNPQIVVNNNTHLSYYDCDIVIQHAPTDMIVTNSLIKKSIIIPISAKTNKKNCEILKYKKFDKMLVSNKYEFDFFKKIFGNKVVLYKFLNLSKNVGSLYNAKFLNFTQKFYLIGNYSSQKHFIRKIILSFMVAFRGNPKVSLMLFLDDDHKDLENINNEIQAYAKQINLNFYNRQIVITPFDDSEEALNIIHNTGDVYISGLVSINNVHCDLAQSYKKKIIYIDRLENIPIPTDTEHTAGDMDLSVTTQSLSDSMKSILEIKKPQYFLPDSKYIKDIITKI